MNNSIQIQRDQKCHKHKQDQHNQEHQQEHKHQQDKHSQNNQCSKIPVVIMAGGLGTRAASIDSSVPKPLIPIGGKPILQWEIECLVKQG